MTLRMETLSSMWKVTFLWHNNILLSVHSATVSLRLMAQNEPKPPQMFHPVPRTGLAFCISICQWQGLTWPLCFSKGSVCDSLSQSRFKQLPQPGSVPLSSSYIFTPLGGRCLWLSWVSVWDTQVLTDVSWLAQSALSHCEHVTLIRKGLSYVVFWFF